MSARKTTAWLILLVGGLYMVIPLVATFLFSLRGRRDELSFVAYQRVLEDPAFVPTLWRTLGIAVAAIVVSLAIVVPTAFWVDFRFPRLRPLVEFLTLLPFVVPAIILVFGLIRIYSGPPLPLTNTSFSSNILLVCAYAILSLPYMYRSVENGLQALNVRTLTEAAQSLGARLPSILFRVIFPNLRVALLSGALLTFAIVMGEFTIAVFLARPTLGPYMALLVRNKAYEPAALAILSFGLTWAAMGIIALVGRQREGERAVVAIH